MKKFIKQKIQYLKIHKRNRGEIGGWNGQLMHTFQGYLFPSIAFNPTIHAALTLIQMATQMLANPYDSLREID